MGLATSSWVMRFSYEYRSMRTLKFSHILLPLSSRTLYRTSTQPPDQQNLHTMSSQASSSNPTQSAEPSQASATSSPTHHAGSATPTESNIDHLRVPTPAPLHADSGYNTNASDNESNADDPGEAAQEEDDADTARVADALLAQWHRPEIGGGEQSTASTNGDESPGPTVARAPSSEAGEGGSTSA